MAALHGPEQGPAGPLTVTVFSDFACPYSYVTEAALLRVQQLPDDASNQAPASGVEAGEAGPGSEPTAGSIEIVYRSYELAPEPLGLEPPDSGDIEWATVSRMATLVGAELHRPKFRPRTRKAHEASHFARGLGLETELRREIFSAYWGSGQDIGRIDVLTSLAAPLGIDPEELRIALDIDTHRDAVLHDEEVAQRLRIRGTPTIFIGTGRGARVVGGALSQTELRALIREGGSAAESSSSN